MKRIVFVHVALLALVLGFSHSPAYAADGDADDKAIRDLAGRFFAAYAAKDLDAFMALWSEKSPDYEAKRKFMAGLFAATGLIEAKGQTVVRARREGKAASVRVQVELTGNDAKTGKPHPALGRLDRVLDLAREDGDWKVIRYSQSDQRLMERLVAAKSKGERLRLLDDDSELVGPKFLQMVLREENARSRRGKFDEGASLLDVAQNIADGLGDVGMLALCQRGRGFSMEKQARYGPALSSFQAALPLFREAHNSAWEAIILNDIGNVYYETSRYAEALQQYQDSLKITRELKDRANEAANLNKIGLVYKAMDQNAEALQPFQDSLKIFRELGNRDGEAANLLDIGGAYDDMGRHSEALQQFQGSLKIARDLKDRAVEAKALGAIGNVYDETSRYGEAFQQYQDKLKIERELGDRLGEAGALNSVGLVYKATGQPTEALRQYQDALKIERDLGDRAGEARAVNNIGILYAEVGRYAEALRQYQDSLKIKRELGDQLGEALTLSNIGVVYAVTGRNEEALRQYRDSLKIKRELGDRPGEALILNNIGSVYHETGRYREALQQYQDSLKISRHLGDQRMAATTLDNIGLFYQRQKDWTKALQAFGEAASEVESIRTNTREPSLQISFLKGQTWTYFYLSRCQLELQKPGEAFAASERMKARSLVDILQQGKADLRRGMSEAERKEEQGLQDQLTALGVQRENLQSRHADKDVQDAAQRDLKRGRQDLEDFRRNLFLHRPGLAARRAEFAPASLDELGRSYSTRRPGRVILSYLVGEKETLLFVLTAPAKDGAPARLTVHRIDMGSKELAGSVQAFRDACSDPGKGEPDSNDLYRWLIAPAADQLADAKQIIIVPDDVLHTLPFQALKDADGKYLIEHFAVSYAPSVTALVKMEELGATRRKEYTGKPATLLAVGVSDFGRRERPLPAALAEARALAGAFGDDATLLPGAQATRANVEAAWRGCRYLHFATHGRLNPDAPLYSSLVLSTAGDGDEGVLYARDLVDGAEIPAELAVMSACQTGLGKQVSGEGLQGLSWSWFAAGVPSTVASQWSVGDDSTARLMKVFYTRLKAGDSKAEALRQAELSLLQDDATRHPFYWAPFVLVGDDR